MSQGFQAGGQPEPTLGGLQDGLESSMGGNRDDLGRQVPGMTYGGGPQFQRAGFAGQAEMQIIQDWKQLMGKLPPGQRPSAEQMVMYSRMLEQTFRNFYVHAVLPPWLFPPMKWVCADARDENILTSMYWSNTTFLTVQAPQNGRTLVRAFTWSADLPDAYDDLTVTAYVDEKPLPCYRNIEYPLAEWEAPEAGFCHPVVLLEPGETFTLRGTSTDEWNIRARVCGWTWFTRIEKGREAASTIVD
jgi:hypothetical protein